MTNMIYRLDDDGLLVFPNVGDAEIRAIDFDFPNLRIRIFQPFDGSRIDLNFTGLQFLYFHTDHPQNVIQSLHVYTSWERVRFPRECDQKVLKQEFGSAGRYVVVIESIAGGPLVCGAFDFSIEIKRDACC